MGEEFESVESTEEIEETEEGMETEESQEGEATGQGESEPEENENTGREMSVDELLYEMNERLENIESVVRETDETPFLQREVTTLSVTDGLLLVITLLLLWQTIKNDIGGILKSCMTQ